MDQELKQRLIGAAVITALAAIFVPMLFDDPIDETGKNINALTLPEIPAKVQEVEIAPLPEKVEDVTNSASAPVVAKEVKSIPTQVDEGVGMPGSEPPHPKLHLSGHEPGPVVKQPKTREPALPSMLDEDIAAAEPEDVKPVSKPVAKSQLGNAVPKPVKPVAKTLENTPAENIGKPESAGNENSTGARWYLNVGSFGQKNNALALLESLKQQGFAAILKEVAGDKGPVFKVRIGPMMDKAKAQVVKSKLSQMNINSFVAVDE